MICLPSNVALTIESRKMGVVCIGVLYEFHSLYKITIPIHTAPAVYSLISSASIQVNINSLPLDFNTQLVPFEFTSRNVDIDNI